MEQKRTVVLFVIGITLAALLLFFLFFSTFTQKPATQTTPTPTPIAQQVNLQGVRVNNFFNSSEQINANGDLLLKDAPTYQIVYLRPFNEFIIHIIGLPFPQVRTEAENAFLQQLGITQEEACNLQVSVGAPKNAEPAYAARRFSLSFCKGEQ